MRERDVGLECDGLINYKFAMEVRIRRKFATDLTIFPSQICDDFGSVANLRQILL